MSNLPEDPTAWLGDPVGMIPAGRTSVVVSVPPAERDSTVVVSLSYGQELETGRDVDAYVRLSLSSARGLIDALSAAVAQVEEHAQPEE